MVSTALYPWQHQAWEQLQQQRGRWPHALLLHGPSGIGKTDFAEWLVEQGIESISLNPDSIIKTIMVVAEKEKTLHKA